MVKVNFNVQKILVAHSQQLSLCALYNQSSSDILWKRLNVRVQKVSSNRTMFPYDKIHKVCFSHLGWLFFPDGRALWSLPRIQVGATFITMTQLTSQPAFGSWTYLLVCHCSLQKGSCFKVRLVISLIITICLLRSTDEEEGKADGNTSSLFAWGK